MLASYNHVSDGVKSSAKIEPKTVNCVETALQIVMFGKRTMGSAITVTATAVPFYYTDSQVNHHILSLG